MTPDDSITPPTGARRVQVIVTHNDNTISYHPVETDWKIDTSHRMLRINRGMGRTLVPLDGVRCFTVENIGDGVVTDLVAEKRAENRIVAWLRAQSEAARHFDYDQYDLAADCIEAGEHR